MRLGSIRVGDIVRVDDGMPYLAEVDDINTRALGDGIAFVGGLRVRPCHGNRALRSVKARDVVTHWKRMGRAS